MSDETLAWTTINAQDIDTFQYPNEPFVSLAFFLRIRKIFVALYFSIAGEAHGIEIEDRILNLIFPYLTFLVKACMSKECLGSKVPCM